MVWRILNFIWLIGLVLLAWFVWTLVDILNSKKSSTTKATFIILLFFVNIVTMIVWLFIRKRK